ncbi:hypothetical protein ABT237_24815 [Streptomyces sp. NPDC001581]|uniref:hypothetical protein n=1 Tax=Streptomyces sp. NPDC001581 TaxID=3154386 RepID=UPI0033191AE8
MISHRIRYLVPLTAVAAVALGGLSMTSATAAAPKTFLLRPTPGIPPIPASPR